MHDSLTGFSPTGWVDRERALVSRAAFVSDDVYRQEQERIFTRIWHFLAHESELPEPGDYVVRRIGSAPVIVVRGDDGGIAAFLNSCRHRGTELCRTDAGNARSFVCPYHGWSYGRDGRLLTTTFDQHFPDGTDFSVMGLFPVARLDSYRGLVFASWNADVPDLPDFLGDIAWYLDALFARTPGGMEVLAPPNRWRAKANWKVGALNFVGDSQHVLTTHVGPVTLDRVRAAEEGFLTAGQDSFQVMTDEGHGCTLTYLAPGMKPENYRTHDEGLMRLYAETLAPEQMQMLHHLRVIVGNVFPNLSFIETQVGPAQKAVIMRLWQPLGGSEMEILSWVLAEKEAPAAYKDAVLRGGIHNFGSAGVFEQDDLVLWASATAASDNPIALQLPYSFQTCLPYLDRPASGHPWPGRAYRPANTEVAQFEFMLRWDRLMSGNA